MTEGKSEESIQKGDAQVNREADNRTKRQLYEQLDQTAQQSERLVLQIQESFFSVMTADSYRLTQYANALQTQGQMIRLLIQLIMVVDRDIGE